MNTKIKKLINEKEKELVELNKKFPANCHKRQSTNYRIKYWSLTEQIEILKKVQDIFDKEQKEKVDKILKLKSINSKGDRIITIKDFYEIFGDISKKEKKK
jgi:hypothetical protein